MWSIVFGLVLGVGFLFSLWASPLHLFALACFVYVAYYVSWARWTGSRNWPWLRSLRIWTWITSRYFPLTYHCAYWDKFAQYGHSYLFIVHPNMYNVAMMAAFGTHGTRPRVISRLSPRVMVPAFVSYIPYVCDLIMWLGGAVHSEDGLKNLLNANCSVVWCPTGMKDALLQDSDVTVVEPSPLSVFEFAVRYGAECRFSLVPVLITGEADLYTNHTQSMPQGWQDMQHLMYKRSGYPGPLPITGAGGTCIPKRRPLHCYIGEPVDPSTVRQAVDARAMSPAQSLRKAFYAHMDDLDVENTIKYVSEP